MTSETRSAAFEHAIGPTGQLTVKVATGDLRLLPSADDSVRVRTLDGRPVPDSVKIETGVGSLSIREASRFLGVSLSIGENMTIGTERSVGLEIEVPPAAETTIQTASGAVVVSGLRGEQHYRSASGDIRLEHVAGRITTETVSGEVAIGVEESVELIVKTVSGDVAIDGEGIERIRLTTTSGDIRLVGSLGAGPHAIETLSGDALIATNSGVRIQARTISGDLRSDLPHSSAGMMGRRSLTVGDGTVELSFRSVSGDLRVVDPAGARAQRVRHAAPVAPAPPAIPAPPAARAAPVASANDRPATEAAASPSDDRRLDILRALERGEIDITTASAELALLDEPTDA